jgi:hypothetical protein
MCQLSTSATKTPRSVRVLNNWPSYVSNGGPVSRGSSAGIASAGTVLRAVRNSYFMVARAVPESPLRRMRPCTQSCNGQDPSSRYGHSSETFMSSPLTNRWPHWKRRPELPILESSPLPCWPDFNEYVSFKARGKRRCSRRLLPAATARERVRPPQCRGNRFARSGL